MNADKDKIERLYLENKANMLKTAMRLTNDYQLAEDAVHQTIEKVIRIIDKIDESNEVRAGGLLCLMTKQAVTELYRKKRSSIGEQIFYGEIRKKVDETDLSEILQQKDIIENLRRSLKWLPQNYSDIIVLRYGYGLTNDEIAGILNIEPNNVYARVHRAKSKIKIFLQKGGSLSE